MTLREKIIATLATFGIIAGTYVIGSTDTVQCLVSDHQIDISNQERICLSDEQFAQLQGADLQAIIDGNYDPLQFPRIAAMAKEDPTYYSEITGELVTKIRTDTADTTLNELNKEIAQEVPEYVDVLKTELITKQTENGYVDVDDYDLHAFVIGKEIEKRGGISISDFSMDNLLERIQQTIARLNDSEFVKSDPTIGTTPDQ